MEQMGNKWQMNETAYCKVSKHLLSTFISRIMQESEFWNVALMPDI
jgi:hypothetical protein